MKSNQNTARLADTTQHTAARVAGAAYLLIIATSILYLIFVEPKITVPGNALATANNIIANELLFRIGAAYEVIMFASVFILALALYVLLKPVNKNLALLGLFWRLGEAILGEVSVMINILILLLINGGDFKAVGTALEPKQLPTLIAFLLDVHTAALLVVFPLLCLGSTVFCYLFFKSKYIPKLLAAFGIFSFLLLLLYTFVAVIFPSYAATIQVVCYPPSILFEVAIGLWLLFRGIKLQPEATLNS